MFRFTILTRTEEAQGDVPRLLRERPFTCATFASAINHYIALGEKQAVKEFFSLNERSGLKRGFWMNERIGWLCHVLYESRTKEPLRPPMFGGQNFPPEAIDWPLYPVAISGSTYFILSEGYRIAGEPEPLTEYISYCQTNGIFRKKSIRVPTRREAIKDATKLRQSPEWKALIWEHRSKYSSYQISEDWVWRFIIQQAESMPK